MLMVAGETSVKVRVTVVLLSVLNVSVCAVKALAVPLPPRPKTDTTWLSRVLALLPTTLTLMLSCAVVRQPVTPKSKRSVYTVFGMTEKV